MGAEKLIPSVTPFSKSLIALSKTVPLGQPATFLGLTSLFPGDEVFSRQQHKRVKYQRDCQSIDR